MTFKVEYAIVNHSRCGNYIYRDSMKVEAENKAEAVDKVKTEYKQNGSQGRFKLFAVYEVA